MTSKIQPRDQAGAFSLPDGVDGPILKICKLPDCLEVYTANATLVMKSPETIDPDRTNPNAMWVYVKIADVGASMPAVARTFLTASEILGAVRLDYLVDSTPALLQMHKIKNTLVTCTNIAEKIGIDMQVESENFRSSAVKLSANARSLPYFPMVPDLNERTTTFLINAKHAIQEICSLVQLFWKFNRSHSSWHHIVRDLKELVHEQNDIMEYAEGWVPLCEKIVNLRNAQEHPKDDNKLHIVNFEMQPDNSIMAPEWHLTGEPPADLCGGIISMANNLVRMAEGIFVRCVNERLPENSFSIIEVIQDVDVKMPIRYRSGVDPRIFGKLPSA